MSGHGLGSQRSAGALSPGRRPGWRFRLRPLAVAAGLSLGLASAGAASASAGATPAAFPKQGAWTALSGGMATESPAPVLWVAPNGTAWDLFPRQAGPNNFTYEAARLGAGGSVASGPADIFPGAHWTSVQFGPTLLGDAGWPLLVFDGIRGSSGAYSLGCAYGALAGPTGWALRPWTLSYRCVGAVSAAAESNAKAKVLAAASPGGWSGGTGVNYRIGVSPAIPPATDDQHIPLSKATAYPAGMANDQHGNGHFYVAWAQVFSTPGGRDGIYVKDVTSGGTALKAPGTGTSTVSADMSPVATLAITNSGTHAGVFLAYCANATPCHVLELWRVGAKKAAAVPSSAGAYGVSIAQGPGGRIWVAWYNGASSKVLVTRSNKADTRFGPVKSYATPCAEHGLLGLGGSPLTRLDIGLSCVSNAKLLAAQYVTQVRAALTLGVPGPVTVGANGAKVTVTVTDAGDPVAGIVVKAGGQAAVTNAAGKATIALPGSIKAGTYGVTATSASYLTATGKLTVKK